MIIDSPIISGSQLSSGPLTQVGDVQITGSLTVSGSINGATISGSVATASYAENAGLLGNLNSGSFVATSSFNAFSGSTAGRINNLEQFSASLDATFATDASVSASILVLSQSVQNSQAALSSSFATTSGSYASASGSLSIRTSNLEATSSTLTSASSSFAAQSASLSTRLTADETNITTLTNASASFAVVSASFSSTSGSIAGRVTLIEGQYATTGSNTFTGVQYISQASNAISFTSTASLYTDGGLRVAKDSFVSGTAYFNNITVYGTSSIEYITSSQVNIGSNVITVNTDTPAIRFGGISVFDSGSTQLTGSLFWDSEKNHWIYSNPSGSAYNSAMLMNGPRNTGSLGDEQGTTNNALMKGQGGDHITSSQMIDDGTTVQIPGNLQVTGSIAGSSTAAFASTVTVNGSNLAITPTTATTYALSVMTNAGGYLRIGRDTSTGALYGDAYAGLVVSSGAYPLIFGTNDTERFRIASTGQATFTGAYINTSDVGIIVSASIPAINFRASGNGRFTIATSYSNSNRTSFIVGTGTNNPTIEALQIEHSTGATTISSNNTAVGLTVNGGNSSDGTVAKFARGGAEKNFYISSTNNQFINLATEGDIRLRTGCTVDQPYATGINALILASTGAATFSSSVSGTSIRSSAVGTFGFNTANNGEFQIYATALDGMIMAGRGSTNDMVIVNKNGSDVFKIPTGTINATFLGSVTAGGTGGRSVVLTGQGAGQIAINGDNSSYATSIVFNNQAGGTTLSGIWAYGSGATLNWLGLGGTAYNGASIYLPPSGNVSIGNQTDTGYKLYVAGDVLIQTNGKITSNGGTLSIGSGGATDFYLANQGSAYWALSYGLSFALVPTGDAVRNLGGPSNRLNTIYATNGTINTSDIREKQNVSTSDLGLEFINKLNPVKYNWIDRDNKTHYGLIAQEIESLNIDNFGALNIEDDKFGLNYIEFIAPIIKAIQEQQAQIEALKTEINELKNKVGSN